MTLCLAKLVLLHFFCHIGPKMAFFAYFLLDKLIARVGLVLAIQVWGIELLDYQVPC